MAGLTEFADTNHLAASHFTAIGAFQSALLGWFDSEKMAFREIPITNQVEIASFSGDIGLINGKPAVHAHAVVAFPDGTTRGGHVISARIWPTLELFLTGRILSASFPRKILKLATLSLPDPGP